MSFRGTMVISVLYVCYSQTGKICYSQCWYFEAVVPSFITGIQSEGIKRFEVFVYMKVICFRVIFKMF